MGSPNRVLCPKQPHLGVAQPKSHTVAVAPSHDWTQARDPVHGSGSLLSATPQPNRLHASHTAGFPPWPGLHCQQGTVSEHTGRGGSSAFRGNSQDGACGVWTSSVWAQDLTITEKKAGLTIIARILESFFSCSQRLIMLLLCIKQTFSEWCTTKSKPLIQSCRNAAVQANDIEPLQQIPGYEEQQTPVPSTRSLKQFALSTSFYATQFQSLKKGKYTSQIILLPKPDLRGVHW